MGEFMRPDDWVRVQIERGRYFNVDEGDDLVFTVGPYRVFTTGHFYGRVNLLAFLADKNAVCAVGLGNKATATSCGIRNQCIWQKVSGSEIGSCG
jgi:hypothetical protein